LPVAATASSLAPEEVHGDSPVPGAEVHAWPGITAGSSSQINASEVTHSASCDTMPGCVMNTVAAARPQEAVNMSPAGPIFGAQSSDGPILEASQEPVQHKKVLAHGRGQYVVSHAGEDVVGRSVAGTDNSITGQCFAAACN
jgi:hypothetical protein